MRLINIGFGSLVSAERIIAVINPDSAPIKRAISDARARGSLIDASYGRKTRAVMIADSGHVILSAFEPEKLAGRISGTDTSESEAETPVG